MSHDQPTMRCPKCGVEEPDFDGFGMLAHTKPAFERGCGFCVHPSMDVDDDGGWTCGLCGKQEVSRVGQK